MTFFKYSIDHKSFKSTNQIDRLRPSIMRLAPTFYTQLKNTASMVGLSVGLFAGYNLYAGDHKFYRQIVTPVCHSLFSAETCHTIAVVMAKYNCFPRYSNCQYPELSVDLFGLHFNHPVGIAAGFDKQGDAILGLLNAGFSFVEIGSVTPEPQPGNDPPRLFCLPKDEAIINRYGFNSDGHDVVYERIRNVEWKGKGVVGVNLGVNKTSENPTKDYVEGVKKFGDICDYLVINVSSPNTPGLRQLQKKKELMSMLNEVNLARKTLSKKTPLLLKISPDETDETIEDIVSVLQTCSIDGIIVSNTTVSRDQLCSPSHICNEPGGLSGKPLSERSTALIARISRLTNRKIPIIGVGGVDSGAEAWKKIMAGASLIQLYTSMVYYGPPIIKKVVKELHTELNKSQYKTVTEILENRNLEALPS